MDMAKGFLIIMMIFGHIGNTAESYSSHNEWIYNICSIERLWTGYFMCAFFSITGYCSNFNKDLKTFINNNIRTLLIPSILISFLLQRVDIFISGDYSLNSLLSLDWKWYLFEGGPFWFLSTIFVSKILYYLLRKLCKIEKNRYFCVFLLYISGFCLDYYHIGPNWWFFHQAFMLVCFLEIGYKLREFDFRKIGIYSVGIYVLSVIVVLALTDFGKVGIFRRITVDWLTIVPNFIVAVTGSISIIWVSLFMEEHGNINKFILYIGKNSLLFYCIQEISLKYNWQIFDEIFKVNMMTPTVIAVVLYMIFVLVSCASFSELLLRSKLRFLAGK